MKILLLGKGGQVGWELQRSLAPLGTLVALDFDSTDYAADFSQPDAVAATVRALRPDVVVNAAAHTAVDKAESEPDFARTLNATTPGAVAQAAQDVGALMVHYSTDYVFDGSGDTPWVETDATGPLSVYGSTKLEGEQLVAQHCARHLIFRTSWVYAARGGNFAKTMLRLAKERERLTVINDQFGAPPVPSCWPTSPPTPSAPPCKTQRNLVCTTWWRAAKPPGTAMPALYWSRPRLLA